MNSLFLSFVIGAGFGGWVFSKLQRQTGTGNAKNAAIGGAVAGVVAFIVVFSIAKMIFH
jgi:hypothetical protein